jgi:hypothetical protein
VACGVVLSNRVAQFFFTWAVAVEMPAAPTATLAATVGVVDGVGVDPPPPPPLLLLEPQPARTIMADRPRATGSFFMAPTVPYLTGRHIMVRRVVT